MLFCAFKMRPCHKLRESEQALSLIEAVVFYLIMILVRTGPWSQREIGVIPTALLQMNYA